METGIPTCLIPHLCTQITQKDTTQRVINIIITLIIIFFSVVQHLMLERFHGDVGELTIFGDPLQVTFR